MYHLIFKFILTILGWKIVPEDQLKSLKYYNKSVALFSHSSYWDFWLLILYALAHPGSLDDVFVVVKPQPFENPLIRKFLTYFHCIPATKAEDVGKGFVEKTVELGKSKDKFHLLLSPQGMMKASPWRSGYYHIATQLDAKIMVIGFDYEKKCFVSDSVLLISQHFYKENQDQERSMIEPMLQEEMGKIVPLYENCSYVKIKEHNKDDVGPIDYVLFSDFLSSCIKLYMCYQMSVLLALHYLILFVSSFLYHREKEERSGSFIMNTKPKTLYLFYAKITFYLNYFLTMNHSDIILKMLLISYFIFYLCIFPGSGSEDKFLNKDKNLRTRHYILWHSLYHFYTILYFVTSTLRNN